MKSNSVPACAAAFVLISLASATTALARNWLASEPDATPAITADTALRLERVLGLEARVWLTLQTHYELESANSTLRKRIEREATPLDGVT